MFNLHYKRFIGQYKFVIDVVSKATAEVLTVKSGSIGDGHKNLNEALILNNMKQLKH